MLDSNVVDNHNDTAENHGDVNDPFQKNTVELVEQLPTGKVACDATQQPDGGEQQNPGGDQMVDNAEYGGIDVDNRKIKLDRRKIDPVFCGGIGHVQHNGRPAGGKQTVKSASRKAGNSAFQRCGMKPDGLHGEDKIKAQRNKNEAEDDGKNISGNVA